MIGKLQKERVRNFAGCIVVVMLVFANAVPAQQTETATELDNVQAEFSQAFASIAEYSAEKRDQALAVMEETLERLDAQIEQTEKSFRENWANMSDAAQEEASAALNTLRERRNQLSEAYGALSQGASSAWRDLMAGVRSVWADFERAWDDAAAIMDPERRSDG